MKNHILLFFALIAVGAAAQGPNVKYQQAQWPLKGKSAGTGIIAKPGETINGESNYGSLFIKGNEGDTVVAPVDGIVSNFSYVFMPSMPVSYTRNFDADKLKSRTEVDVKREIANGLLKDNRQFKGDIARYTSLIMGITTKEGDKYYVYGLNYLRPFKTGEKVSKGDAIGTVGYGFYAFEMPHICVSREISGKDEDPMSVFGIKSTFKKYTAKRIDMFRDIVPTDSLKRAYSIMRSSLEEIHPGLYDYVAKSTLDSLFLAAEKKIKPMTGYEFVKLIQPIIKAIADSHTGIQFMAGVAGPNFPPVHFVYDASKDKAIVVAASAKSGLKAGDVIVEVGGKSISDWAVYIKSTTIGGEGYNELAIDRYLAGDMSTAVYKDIYPKQKPLLFKTAAGKSVSVAYAPFSSYMKIRKMRRSGASPFSFAMVKPDVAVLKISTFSLTDVELDSLEATVGALAAKKIGNLIVDVRDNAGGDIEAGRRILSFLLDKPQKIFAYRMVNSNSTYATLEYSDNWSSEYSPFSEFKEGDGKRGFYCYAMEDSTDSQIIPSEKIHYDGNLYVLTNEKSVSMASDFAGALLGQKNCTLIGRETGSCYYQMNAEKFASIILPQAGIAVRMPMVKIVMHDVPNPKIPYGHGTIPDIAVPLTIKELRPSSPDLILETALKLIEGKQSAASL